MLSRPNLRSDGFSPVGEPGPLPSTTTNSAKEENVMLFSDWTISRILMTTFPGTRQQCILRNNNIISTYDYNARVFTNKREHKISVENCKMRLTIYGIFV